MKLSWRAGEVAMLLALAFGASAAVPAFPGAEGFGAGARGGRGGRVMEVTNLADAGPGSFRAAIETAGPRIVVFRVSGTIELASEVLITHPFLTIAGQTAPGDGIALKTQPTNTRSALTIRETAHDVVIRHLRVRPGPHEGFKADKKAAASTDSSEVKDAIQILGARRVILDHCSASWATDEVVSTFYGAQEITIQWCIIAEALRRGTPEQALPGKGLLIGSKGGERISVHHNLFIHNVGRNPLIKASGVVDVVNNVVLAPATVAMAIDSELAAGKANFIGNYVLAPKADGLVYGLAIIGSGPFELFLQGNVGPYRENDGQPEDWFVHPRNRSKSWFITAPHKTPAIATSTAERALEDVLAGAGSALPKRDAMDERLVNEVRRRQTRVVDNPLQTGGWPVLRGGEAAPDTDHDGMPDRWEARHGFDPNNATDGSADADGDGCTNVEEFLNGTDPKRKDG